MNKLVISMFGAMIFATRRLPKLRSLPPRRRRPKSTRSTILAPPSKAKSLVEKPDTRMFATSSSIARKSRARPRTRTVKSMDVSLASQGNVTTAK